MGYFGGTQTKRGGGGGGGDCGGLKKATDYNSILRSLQANNGEREHKILQFASCGGMEQ